ncbi:hypothetical protein BDR22DRAFT_823508 [Usnea florida]
MTCSVVEYLIEMRKIPIYSPTKDAVYHILGLKDQSIDTWGNLGVFIDENANDLDAHVINRVGEMAQAQWDQMKHASDLTMALEDLQAELARKAKQDEDQLYRDLVSRFEDVNGNRRSRELVVRIIKQAAARNAG